MGCSQRGRGCAVLFLGLGTSAFGQQLTTAPSAAAVASPVPVDAGWLLGMLSMALLALGLLALCRGRSFGRALPLLVSAICAGLFAQSAELRAQLLLTFSDPAGETLSIPVTQIPSGGDIAGFEVADFTNASGVALRVASITQPDSAQCFPGGLSGVLLPAGSAPTPVPSACAAGLVLADGDSCRVDVDTVCRNFYTSLAEVSAISPASGSASGQVGVTITGANLAGATGVTFDGVPATSVNVVGSTTITAVAPAHAAGAVDVAVSAPAGTATLASGFTYLATAVGQAAGGGVITALNGGNSLVAATADSSAGIQWGGFGTATGAQSLGNGAGNTAQIVAVLGNNGGTPYAAQLCADYEVDSQGNTPCQAGNACYTDWFLPAAHELSSMYLNRVAVGGYALGSYWASTEAAPNEAYQIPFSYQSVTVVSKSDSARVRCTRTLTP
ncbi:midcut-by-XrtH protein [Haliea sp. E17]|uniref:midcut-by-XrtH protein n=1 Tax=Haliea sp. E17 TaxID=3401576 RepID=UPI003AABBB07